jgi:RES domain-containing protein
MDEFLKSLLMTSALSSSRQDESVARQGVMNHQTAAHLMDLTFVRDATEMSIPESYAVQGLSLAHTPREAQSGNLASGTPK